PPSRRKKCQWARASRTNHGASRTLATARRPVASSTGSSRLSLMKTMEDEALSRPSSRTRTARDCIEVRPRSAAAMYHAWRPQQSGARTPGERLAGAWPRSGQQACPEPLELVVSGRELGTQVGGFFRQTQHLFACLVADVFQQPMCLVELALQSEALVAGRLELAHQLESHVVGRADRLVAFLL